MSFNYQNPLVGVIENRYIGVSRDSTVGNTFSVLNVGGYMEVWNLSDLEYSTFGGTANIENSGNTIPVTFYKRPVPVISDRITLNSDGISSGRRRIGMMTYVHETDTTYQYQIDNYDTLWSNAATDGCITSASTSYTILNRVGGLEKASGQALIAAWTGSTIEGVNGVNRNDARWRIFYGSDTQITGGTYYSAITTLDLYNNTGGTISISGFNGTVTGGTYNSGTSTLTLNNSDGSVVNIGGIMSNAGTLTVYDATSGVTALNVTGMTFSGASVINNGGGNVLINITGGTSVSGTTNYIVKFTGSTGIGDTVTPIVETNGGVAIGGTSVDNSAIFELSSTSRGFLSPRMTETERNAISLPATGLLIYQTDGDEGYYIHKSFGWVQII